MFSLCWLPSIRFKIYFLFFDISNSKLGIFQFMKFFTFCFSLKWILMENITFSSAPHPPPQKKRVLIKFKYVCLLYTGTKEQRTSSLLYKSICSLVAWPLCLREECTTSKFLSMKQQLSREAVRKMTTQLEADDSAQIQRTIKTK